MTELNRIPARDQMHQFEVVSCTRLTPEASGVVRSDILVARNTPQHLERNWEVTPADIQWTDALYPVAQHAMQRGCYMPNLNCRRRSAPAEKGRYRATDTRRDRTVAIKVLPSTFQAIWLGAKRSGNRSFVDYT